MDGWPNYWPGLPPMWYATHCVGPVSGLDRPARGIRELLWLRHDSQGTDQELRLALRRRDRAHQVQGHGCERPHHPLAVRHRAAVSREHRRLRQQGIRRMAAHRARAARDAHREAARAEDSQAREDARLREAPAQAASSHSPPAASMAARARRRTSASPRAPATAAAIRTSPTRFVDALVEDRDPFPNAKQSANWTCVGLCAHESALEGGAIVKLPTWTL